MILTFLLSSSIPVTLCYSVSGDVISFGFLYSRPDGRRVVVSFTLLLKIRKLPWFVMIIFLSCLCLR